VTFGDDILPLDCGAERYSSRFKVWCGLMVAPIAPAIP
jgi:hypothetical protein